MDVRSDIFPDTPDGFHPRDVSVRLVRPDERIRWDRLMNQHHYRDYSDTLLVDSIFSEQ